MFFRTLLMATHVCERIRRLALHFARPLVAAATASQEEKEAHAAWQSTTVAHRAPVLPHCHEGNEVRQSFPLTCLPKVKSFVKGLLAHLLIVPPWVIPPGPSDAEALSLAAFGPHWRPRVTSGQFANCWSSFWRKGPRGHHGRHP